MLLNIEKQKTLFRNRLDKCQSTLSHIPRATGARYKLKGGETRIFRPPLLERSIMDPGGTNLCTRSVETPRSEVLIRPSD